MLSLDYSERVKCTMFGRMKQVKGWDNLNYKKLKANLFVLIIDGEASFVIEERSFNVSAGDILIIPAKTYYKAQTDTYCEYYFAHFSGKIEKASQMHSNSFVGTESSFSLPPYDYKSLYFDILIEESRLFERIRSIIVDCLSYSYRHSYAERLLLDNEFNKILLLIAAYYEEALKEYPKCLKKIMIYVKKNLTSPMSLADVAEKCSVSAAYASRLFRKHLDMTVSEYINREKLAYACELKRNTNLSIGEIAEYLGYCDIYYFSKLFKKYYGKPLSRYF